MLVLTRKENESVRLYAPDGTYIGDITIVEIDRGKIRVGFDLPRAYNIVRAEIDTNNVPDRSTDHVQIESGGSQSDGTTGGSVVGRAGG